MDLPVDPINMPTAKMLDLLHAGHREAAEAGPQAALSYLQQTLQETLELPSAVRMVIHELISEAQAELQDWEGCAASLAMAQEERRRAQTEGLAPVPKPREDDPPNLEEPPKRASLGHTPSLAHLLVSQPAAAPAQPHPAKGSVAKYCCKCGKDVTHRNRRKDPVSDSYLCLGCYSKAPQKKGLTLKWTVVKALVIGLLVILGITLLSLGLAGYF